MRPRRSFRRQQRSNVETELCGVKYTARPSSRPRGGGAAGLGWGGRAQGATTRCSEAGGPLRFFVGGGASRHRKRAKVRRHPLCDLSRGTLGAGRIAAAAADLVTGLFADQTASRSPSITCRARKKIRAIALAGDALTALGARKPGKPCSAMRKTTTPPRPATVAECQTHQPQHQTKHGRTM